MVIFADLMMRNSGKSKCLFAKKVKQRRVRRKRLRFQRMTAGKLTQVSVATAVGQVLRKRRPSFKEIPACEPQNVRPKEDDIVADLRPVNIPSNSGSGAPPSKMVDGVDAGEGTLVDEINVPGEKELECLDNLSYGIISVIGRRRAMEDAVAVDMGVGGKELAFFAVYDGHGGSAVANACSVRLHKLLAVEIERSCGGTDWREIMRGCFKKMDEEVNECVIGCGGVPRMIGSTAVVVVVGKEEIVVANCGNSRAILCRGDGIPVELSHDHKPDRPDERARLEEAGGRIVDWNGSRVLGVLATSRSIGDVYLKPYVISEPEVTVSKRTRADNFLIVASDGLWDVVSNELACDVVKLCLKGRIGKNKLTEGTTLTTNAATILAELAIAKGSKDNISVIVVELEKELSSLVENS